MAAVGDDGVFRDGDAPQNTPAPPFSAQREPRTQAPTSPEVEVEDFVESSEEEGATLHAQKSPEPAGACSSGPINEEERVEFRRGADKKKKKRHSHSSDSEGRPLKITKTGDPSQGHTKSIPQARSKPYVEGTLGPGTTLATPGETSIRSKFIKRVVEAVDNCTESVHHIQNRASPPRQTLESILTEHVRIGHRLFVALQDELSETQTAELAALRLKHELLQGDLKKAETSEKRLNRKAKKLEAELERVKAELKAAEDEAAPILAEKENLESELSGLRTELESQAKELDEERAEKKLLKDQIGFLEALIPSEAAEAEMKAEAAREAIEAFKANELEAEKKKIWDEAQRSLFAEMEESPYFNWAQFIKDKGL